MLEETLPSPVVRDSLEYKEFQQALAQLEQEAQTLSEAVERASSGREELVRTHADKLRLLTEAWRRAQDALRAKDRELKPLEQQQLLISRKVEWHRKVLAQATEPPPPPPPQPPPPVTQPPGTPLPGTPAVAAKLLAGGPATKAV